MIVSCSGVFCYLTPRSLDLSFNNIRHIPTLPSLTKVNVLYFVQNKISRIDEGSLDWCSETITSLELGGNRIRVSQLKLLFGTRRKFLDLLVFG